MGHLGKQLKSPLAPVPTNNLCKRLPWVQQNIREDNPMSVTVCRRLTEQRTIH